MARTKSGSRFVNFLVAILFIGVSGLAAQSCRSGKRCGCGDDLNGVYFSKHKRHSY